MLAKLAGGDIHFEGVEAEEKCGFWQNGGFRHQKELGDCSVRAQENGTEKNFQRDQGDGEAGKRCKYSDLSGKKKGR